MKHASTKSLIQLSIALSCSLLMACQAGNPLGKGVSSQTSPVQQVKLQNPKELRASAQIPAGSGKIRLSLRDLVQDFRTQAIRCDDILTLNLSITGIGIPTPIASTATKSGGGCEFTTADLSIPVGKSRVISLSALDEGGAEIARIKGVTDILPGQTSTLDISYRTYVTASIIDNLINRFQLVGTGLGNQLGKVYAANLNLSALQTWVDGLIGVSGAFPNLSYAHHPLLVKANVLADAIFTNNGQIPSSAPAGYLTSPASIQLNLTGIDTGNPLKIQVGDPISAPINLSTPDSSETVTLSNIFPGSWSVFLDNGAGNQGENVSFDEGQTVNYSLDFGNGPTVPSANWTRFSGGLAGVVNDTAIDSNNNLYSVGPGGVYVNEGSGWFEANQGLPTDPIVTKVAASTSVAGDRHVYITLNNNHVYRRDFVNGSTWEDLGTPVTPSGGLELTMLFADPADPDHVFVGTNQGDFKHATNATNANPLLVSWATPGFFTNPGVPITSMVRSNFLYYLGTHNGLYTAGAPSPTGWTSQNSGLTDLLIDAMYVNSTESTLMAGTSSGQLFVSSSLGISWTIFTAGLTGQPIHDILQDPLDASRSIYLATSSGLLKASDTTPINGRPDSSGFSSAGTGPLPLPPQAPANPAMTSLLLEPAGTLRVGTNGAGLNTWTNTTNSWGYDNTTVRTAKVQAMAVAPGGGGLYFGLGGGGVARTLNQGTSFDQMLNVAVDGTERNVSGIAAENGSVGGLFNLYMGTVGSGVWVLNNIDNTAAVDSAWVKVGTAIGDNNVFSMLLVPGTKLLAGTTNGVYVTTCPSGGSCNNGSNWTLLTGGSAPGTTYSMAERPGAIPSLYAGTVQSVCTYSGSSWTSASIGNATQRVTALATLPTASNSTDDDIVYAGMNNSGSQPNFFRSIDAGATFTAMTNPVDNVDINALAVDPNNANTVYAGTAKGIYVTLDGGNNWSPFNSGSDALTDIDVLSLMIDSGKLYAGTRQRSVYVTDLSVGQ